MPTPGTINAWYLAIVITAPRTSNGAFTLRSGEGKMRRIALAFLGTSLLAIVSSTSVLAVPITLESPYLIRDVGNFNLPFERADGGSSTDVLIVGLSISNPIPVPLGTAVTISNSLGESFTGPLFDDQFRRTRDNDPSFLERQVGAQILVDYTDARNNATWSFVVSNVPDTSTESLSALNSTGPLPMASNLQSMVVGGVINFSWDLPPGDLAAAGIDSISLRIFDTTGDQVFRGDLSDVTRTSLSVDLSDTPGPGDFFASLRLTDNLLSDAEFLGNRSSFNARFQVSVSEPGSLALMAASLILIGSTRRRRTH